MRHQWNELIMPAPLRSACMIQNTICVIAANSVGQVSSAIQHRKRVVLLQHVVSSLARLRMPIPLSNHYARIHAKSCVRGIVMPSSDNQGAAQPYTGLSLPHDGLSQLCVQMRTRPNPSELVVIPRTTTTTTTTATTTATTSATTSATGTAST